MAGKDQAYIVGLVLGRFLVGVFPFLQSGSKLLYDRRIRLASDARDERSGECLVVGVNSIAENVIERVVPEIPDPEWPVFQILRDFRLQLLEHLLDARDVIVIDMANHD